MRYIMVIDLRRCVGCQACTVACKQKNATPPGTFWSRVLVSEQGSYPNSRIRFQPILCMHCAEAPCYRVCPTGATEKQPDGIITIDTEKCIGCRYCMIACPYNARVFNYGPVQPQYEEQDLTPFELARQGDHVMGQVGKCDFCADRVADGLEPKCVETCPAKARFFGDLDDPDSEVTRLVYRRDAYRLQPELGVGPSVYYLPS